MPQSRMVKFILVGDGYVWNMHNPVNISGINVASVSSTAKTTRKYIESSSTWNDSKRIQRQTRIQRQFSELYKNWNENFSPYVWNESP